MCNSKPKVTYTPPPAPAVAPPAEVKTENLETGRQGTTTKKQKGKRKLTIPTGNSGTGVNL